MNVNKISVKVPPFYPQKPALWFAMLESQFILANVTVDSTKYHITMSQLDPVYAAEVEDIITAPPADDKYERLKRELVRRLSASREKVLKQLLTDEELGDRKPSQFLRHLMQLAGSGVPEEFLRSIWTSRLPISTQTIIAAKAKDSLEDLADLADRIHDVVPPYNQIAAVQPPHHPSTSGSSGEIAALQQQVQALTEKLDRMSRPRSRSRSNSRNRDRSSSSTRSESSYKMYPICWYHSRHGERAHRCIKPCDYVGNGQGTR